MPNLFPPPPEGSIVVHPDPASPDDIRAAGWVVAVHNDYRLAGVPHTFWLFTKEDKPPHYACQGDGHGRYANGEGPTDAAALNAVRWAVGLPMRPIMPPGCHETPAAATYCDGPHKPPRCPFCVNRDGSPTFTDPECVAARAAMGAP